MYLEVEQVREMLFSLLQGFDGHTYELTNIIETIVEMITEDVTLATEERVKVLKDVKTTIDLYIGDLL